MSTGDLLKKLAAKYPVPAYAFLTQVRNGTGYLNVTRTADAMVMSLWPSRGLELIGFEMKISRSDWLRELKNPEKAEEMVKFCDRWYIVAPDTEVVKLEELPAAWGLMTATGKGKSIKIIKEAPTLKPAECDRLFLASIMRNITERMLSRDLVNAEINRQVESARQGWRDQVDKAEQRRQEVEDRIMEFERISGLRISTWKDDNQELAKAVKDVREGRYKKADEALKKIRTSALKIAKFIDGEIHSYEI